MSPLEPIMEIVITEEPKDAGPPRMTRQEMFERAVTGLRSQGFERCGIPSSEHKSGVQCMYNLTRAGDGLQMHCAAGWLITDIEIRSSHNRVSIGELASIYRMVAERIEGNESFVMELQNAHDGASDRFAMVQRLRDVGLMFALDVSCLDEVVL